MQVLLVNKETKGYIEGGCWSQRTLPRLFPRSFGPTRPRVAGRAWNMPALARTSLPAAPSPSQKPRPTAACFARLLLQPRRPTEHGLNLETRRLTVTKEPSTATLTKASIKERTASMSLKLRLVDRRGQHAPVQVPLPPRLIDPRLIPMKAEVTRLLRRQLPLHRPHRQLPNHRHKLEPVPAPACCEEQAPELGVKVEEEVAARPVGVPAQACLLVGLVGELGEEAGEVGPQEEGGGDGYVLGGVLGLEDGARGGREAAVLVRVEPALAVDRELEDAVRVGREAVAEGGGGGRSQLRGGGRESG